jgi:hypothetical protein
MSATTPAQRSRRYLTEQGYLVETVEVWLPHAKRRKDLLGCGDLLAVKAGEPPLLVQVTTTDHQADRLAKALVAPGLRRWLETGRTAFAVHGWGERRGPGGKPVWDVTVRAVALADLEQPLAVTETTPRRRRRPKAEKQLALFDQATEPRP